MIINCHFCKAKCCSGKQNNYCNACLVFNYPYAHCVSMSLQNNILCTVDYYYKRGFIWVHFGYPNDSVKFNAVVSSSKELQRIIERVIKNKNYI